MLFDHKLLQLAGGAIPSRREASLTTGKASDQFDSGPVAGLFHAARTVDLPDRGPRGVVA